MDVKRVDRVVDAFGLLCPMPIIKAGAELKKMESGQVVEVIATDPGARSDLKEWCKANRNTYIGDEQKDRIYTIWIGKGQIGRE